MGWCRSTSRSSSPNPSVADTLVVSRIGEAEIVCRVSAASKPKAGSPLRIMADAKHIHLFDPESGVALS